MSRKGYLAALTIVAGVSVVFGMLLATGPLRSPDREAPAAWSPALAAPPPPAGAAALVPPVSFADVAERADAAVVSVENVELRKVSRTPFHDFEFPFEDPFRFFFGPRERDRDRDPRRQGQGQDETEQRRVSGGSGFIVSQDGYILTNNHVIENATKLVVTMEEGKKYEARVIGKDEMIDLALLKIESARPLPTLTLGDSDSLRVGEWVIAIGNPLGYSHTVTVGVVSGKGRQIAELGSLDRSLANFIQTDAAINFGNSGGPLLNARGEVVGINTAITRNYGPYQGLIQGIGFALPINQVRAVLEQLKETGRVERGYLGISISPVRENEQQAFGLPSTDGAFVQDVTPGLPADKAGVKPGDVVVSVNGQPVKDTSELIRIVSGQRPGETVNLGIIREKREISLRVKLADRREQMERTAGGGRGEEEDEEGESGEEGSSFGRLGVRVAEITPDLARRNRLPETHQKGVWVVSVRPLSNAYEENLRPGMIITKVNENPVRSVADFRAAVAKVRPGEFIRLYVVTYFQGDEAGRFIVFRVDR